MRQGALTIVADLAPGTDEALGKLLVEHDDGDELGFPKTTTVHFGRVVLLPPKKSPGGVALAPHRLALETNYDGEENEHLDDLVTAMGESLRRVLGHCDDFPASADDAATKQWLVEHAVPTQAFYVGHQGFTRERILRNRAVRAALEEAFDACKKDPGFLRQPLRAIRNELKRRLAADHPEVVVDRSDPEGPPSGELLRDIVTGGIPLVLFVLTQFWWIIPLLLWKEAQDRKTNRPVLIDHPTKDAAMAAILETEDWLPQNPLTILSTVKDGWFRRVLLRAVLFVIGRLGRYYYRSGHLGDMWAIHFARWVVLDDGRLLFFSNYDGSWESYLGDFVDKAAKGLTSIWSNTVGYPSTSLLVLDGAKDEEAFKAWTRGDQLPTQLWYTAYPDRTVRNVWADQAIVKGLDAALDKDIRKFLESL